MTTTTKEDLSKWQVKSIEVAECLIEQNTNVHADFFVAHVNFLSTRAEQGSHVRIHNIGHIDSHLQSIARRSHCHSATTVISPGRRDIMKIIERISGIDQGYSVKVILPEGNETMMIRTLAIAAIVNKVPLDCLPFIQSIEGKCCEVTQGANTANDPFIQYFELIFSNTAQTRISLPIPRRPTGVAYIRTCAGEDTINATNEMIKSEGEILHIGPPRGAPINDGWKQITFNADQKTGDLADYNTPDNERENLIQDINDADDEPELTLCYLDADTTFYIVRITATDPRIDVRRELNIIKRKISIASDMPSPFTYVLLNNGMMCLHCSKLETLCELSSAAAQRNLYISVKAADAAVRIGQSNDGAFTATPIGVGALDHEYHVIRNDHQIITEADIALIDTHLRNLLSDRFSIESRTIGVMHQERQVWAVKVQTRDRLTLVLPYQIGDSQYDIIKGVRISRPKFQATRTQVAPHTAQDVAKALQQGTAQHQGRRIHINNIGNGGYLFNRIRRDFEKEGNAHEKWYKHNGKYKGINTGFAILEGNKMHVVGPEISDLCGKIPDQKYLETVMIDANITGERTKLRQYCDTSKPIIAVVQSVTISIELHDQGDNSSRGTPSCRIDITMPNKVTIIIWGQAVESARITPHDDGRSSVAIVNCECRKVQRKVDASNVGSPKDSCVDMSIVKRSSLATPANRHARERQRCSGQPDKETQSHTAGKNDVGMTDTKAEHETHDVLMSPAEPQGNENITGGDQPAVPYMHDTDTKNGQPGPDIGTTPTENREKQEGRQVWKEDNRSTDGSVGTANQNGRIDNGSLGSGIETDRTEYGGCSRPQIDRKVTDDHNAPDVQEQAEPTRNDEAKTTQADDESQATIDYTSAEKTMMRPGEATCASRLTEVREGSATPSTRQGGVADSGNAEAQGQPDTPTSTSGGSPESHVTEIDTSSGPDLDKYEDTDEQLARGINRISISPETPPSKACSKQAGSIGDTFKRQSVKPYLLTAVSIARHCTDAEEGKAEDAIAPAARKVSICDALRADDQTLGEAITRITKDIEDRFKDEITAIINQSLKTAIQPGQDVQYIVPRRSKDIDICSKFRIKFICTKGCIFERTIPSPILDEETLAKVGLTELDYNEGAMHVAGEQQCGICGEKGLMRGHATPAEEAGVTICQITNETHPPELNGMNAIAKVQLRDCGTGQQSVTILQGANAGREVDISAATCAALVRGEKRQLMQQEYKRTYGIYRSKDNPQGKDPRSTPSKTQGEAEMYAIYTPRNKGPGPCDYEEVRDANDRALKQLSAIGSDEPRNKVITATASNDAIIQAIGKNAKHFCLWGTRGKWKEEKKHIGRITKRCRNAVSIIASLHRKTKGKWRSKDHQARTAVVFVESGNFESIAGRITKCLETSVDQQYILLLFEDKEEHQKCITDQWITPTTNEQQELIFSKGGLCCAKCGEPGHSKNDCVIFPLERIPGNGVTPQFNLQLHQHIIDDIVEVTADGTGHNCLINAISIGTGGEQSIEIAANVREMLCEEFDGLGHDEYLEQETHSESILLFLGLNHEQFTIIGIQTDEVGRRCIAGGVYGTGEQVIFLLNKSNNHFDGVRSKTGRIYTRNDLKADRPEGMIEAQDTMSERRQHNKKVIRANSEPPTRKRSSSREKRSTSSTPSKRKLSGNSTDTTDAGNTQKNTKGRRGNGCKKQLDFQDIQDDSADANQPRGNDSGEGDPHHADTISNDGERQDSPTACADGNTTTQTEAQTHSKDTQTRHEDKTVDTSQSDGNRGSKPNQGPNPIVDPLDRLSGAGLRRGKDPGTETADTVDISGKRLRDTTVDTACCINEKGDNNNLKVRESQRSLHNPPLKALTCDPDTGKSAIEGPICEICGIWAAITQCSHRPCQAKACKECLVPSRFACGRMICPSHEANGINFDILQFDNLNLPSEGEVASFRPPEVPQPAKKRRTTGQTNKDNSRTYDPEGIGVISLFDGGGNTWQMLSELDIKPSVVTIAESNSILRPLVGGEHGYSASRRNWTICKYGCPSVYLKDAWDTINTCEGEVAKVLRETMHFIKNDQLLLIGGPPCSQVTAAHEEHGVIGFCGKDSVHLHVFHIIYLAAKRINPKVRIYIVIENAGSMHEAHREYLHTSLGLPKEAIKTIDTLDWTNVERKRCIITPARVPGTNPIRQNVEFDGDFRQHPISVNAPVAPLMTPRRKTDLGNPVWSDSYYAARHLLFSEEKSDPERFQRMKEHVIEPDGRPIIPVAVENYLPQHLVEDWEKLQTWSVSKAKCAYFRNNPGKELEGGKNNDGTDRGIKVIQRETSNTLLLYVEHGDQEVSVTVDGNGSPFEPGDGSISIHVKVTGIFDGKTTSYPGRVEVEQVWPKGIDRRTVAATRFTGFPEKTFSGRIKDLLNTLADQTDLPFRPLNTRERERAVAYDLVFQDEANKQRNSDSYILGQITGNAYSIKSVIKAVGGAEGSLHLFGQGTELETDYLVKMPPIESIRIMYEKLRQRVIRIRQGRSKWQSDEVCESPFPRDCTEAIKAIENGQIGGPLKPTLHDRVPFQCLVRHITKNNIAVRLNQGVEVVKPSPEAAKLVNDLNGNTLFTTQLVTAERQNRRIEQMTFLKPDMHVSTSVAATNIANAIVQLMTTCNEDANRAMLLINEKAKDNGVEDGAGLFLNISKSSDGKKSANSQALKITTAMTVGLTAGPKPEVNCIFAHGKDIRLLGSNSAGRTLVFLFTDRKVHLDCMFVMQVQSKVAETIPRLSRIDVKFGHQDTESCDVRSAFDDMICNRGLIRPTLARTHQNNVTRAILFDACYAALGRPLFFNGGEIQPLVNSCINKIRGAIDDNRIIHLSMKGVAEMYREVLTILREDAHDLLTHSDIKDVTRKVLTKITGIQNIIIFNHDGTFHREALPPHNYTKRVSTQTLHNIVGPRTNTNTFGREFSHQEHITTAFFAYGVSIANRSAFNHGTAAKETGNTFNLDNAKNFFNTCVPLHQITPELHAAFVRE